MPAPIPADKRAAILADIKAGGTCRGIANTHHVSPDTVRRIAAEAGIKNPFERAQTKRATEARRADNAARRAELAARLLDVVDDLIAQMGGEYLVHSFGGRDNSFNTATLPRPPAGDLRNLMTAVGIAVDKHLALEKHETGADAEHAASLLTAMLDGLRAKHGDTPAPE